MPASRNPSPSADGQKVSGEITCPRSCAASVTSIAARLQKFIPILRNSGKEQLDPQNQLDCIESKGAVRPSSFLTRLPLRYQQAAFPSRTAALGDQPSVVGTA